MSFVTNNVNVQQLSFFDSFSLLTEREKKFLDKSWAKYFAEHIFPKIDEKPYSVLYSDNASRPNTPVNVQIGALIIKEFTNLSDEDILTALMFDIRFQYALHTTSFIEQPMSDRTLGRFRERCYTYEKETGIDLLHETVTSLAEEMAELMKIDFSLKRMDSMMVASSIKKMSRLELLYTCVSNLTREVLKQTGVLPEGLLHYTETDDRNRIIYHNHSEETSVKIATVLNDAKALKELCGLDYAESANYQLLLRVLKEQAVQGVDGSYRLRTRDDGGMNAAILQNPSDPDATYREKAGKQNRGYCANLVEAAGEESSIILDYQYEQNTYSDSQFMKDFLEREDVQEERSIVVTDGAYSGKTNEELANKKNMELVFTNLTGREADDVLADFMFNEDGTKLEQCAGGFKPRSSSYNSQTGQCTVSFSIDQCNNCPYKEKCKPKMFKRVGRKTVSANGKHRAEQQRSRETNEFRELSRFRNGVETLPSTLRRKYHVDQMPVRGLLRSRLIFGCKIGALNFKKFCKYMQSLGSCALKAAIV